MAIEKFNRRGDMGRKKKSQLRDQSICHTFPDTGIQSRCQPFPFSFPPKFINICGEFAIITLLSSTQSSLDLGVLALVSTDLYSLGAYPYKLPPYLSVLSLKILAIGLLLITLCGTS